MKPSRRKANAHFTLAFALATTLAISARAQGIEACNPAYEDADALVHAGGDKLLEARDKLRICARPVCKAWMVKECTKSLTEIDARIPSVVLVAKDHTGADLADVTVTSGDRTLASRLDGRSIEIGPGERVFVFVTSDGRRVSQKAIVKEGEKAQRVTATFDAPARAAPIAPPTAPSAVTPAEASPPPAEENHAPAAEENHRTNGRKIAGLVIAGIGVVGLGVGAGFGISALGQKGDSSAFCGQDGAGPNDCTNDGYDLRTSAVKAGNVSTIFFSAGAVLVVGGLVLWLTAPSHKPDTVARMRGGLIF